MNILTIGNLKKSCNDFTAVNGIMLMSAGLAAIFMVSGILFTKRNHGKA